MALTQSDLDKLDKAIARGVLRVEYADGAVQYQSIEQMLTARKFVAGEVGGASRQSSSSSLAVFSRD